jgi:hypothetical protein
MERLTRFPRAYAMRSEYVTVAVFNNDVDAAMARNYLETGGVRAFLADEETVAMAWELSNAVGGIKLQVKPADFNRAQFLLNQLPEDVRANFRPAHAQDTAFATRKTVEDVHADAIDENPKDQVVDRLFRVTVFGLLFWPLQFYALWLLLTLPTTDGIISPDRRWKVWAAAILNVPLISLLTLPLVCLARGF